VRPTRCWPRLAVGVRRKSEQLFERQQTPRGQPTLRCGTLPLSDRRDRASVSMACHRLPANRKRDRPALRRVHQRERRESPGGEQSPGKQRASVARQRAVEATDSLVEQRLEGARSADGSLVESIGQSGRGRAHAEHAKTQPAERFTELLSHEFILGERVGPRTSVRCIDFGRCDEREERLFGSGSGQGGQTTVGRHPLAGM